jgi:hypothetical protein
MIGVVREALGTLLNGLADQTTVTKALTLNGDTLGASTAATLASVLGVSKVVVVNGSTQNKYPEPYGVAIHFNETGVFRAAMMIVQGNPTGAYAVYVTCINVNEEFTTSNWKQLTFTT